MFFHIHFQFLTISVIVILIGMMTTLGSCRRSRRQRAGRNITDTQCLHRLSRRYLLVDNNLHSSNDSHSNGRINFEIGAKEGTTYCPWTWALDDDPDRIPRYLAKAQCSQCHFNCRAVFYSHSTLFQVCKQRKGVCIWKRREWRLAIAFVYDRE